MSNEFVSTLSASVNAGAMILNDYLLEISDVSGGHRLTITRGSEVQTMDVMDGEGGGAAAEQVQADWNQGHSSQMDYVKNRPCWGSEVGDTITWDGETGGRDIVELPMTSNGETVKIPCCRMADNAPTAQEIRSGDISVTLSDGTTITTADTLLDISMVMADGFAMIASLYIIVVPYNNYALVNGDAVVIFPRKGVYMTVVDGVHASCMRIAGFEFGMIRQLDAKYIPGYDLTYASSLEWDGAFGNREVVRLAPGAAQYFVQVSDSVPSFEALQQAEMEVDFYSAEAGEQTENISAEDAAQYVFQVSETAYAIGEYFAVVAMQDDASWMLGSISVTLPKKGVYFMGVMDDATGAMSGYVSRVSSPAMHVASGAVLQEKCIPQTIQRVGGDVILNSSTEGSDKRFVLTVDDAGALSAVEISE